MKKTWLLPLLLVGLMAGCTNEGAEGGEGGAGGDAAGTTLVADFDLTKIKPGVYNKDETKNTIPVKGDCTAELVATNQVTTGGVGFKSIVASDSGVYRNDAPTETRNLQGIRIENGSLTFTLNEGQTIDKIEIGAKNWTGKSVEAFTIDVQDKTFEGDILKDELQLFTYESKDLNTFVIKNTREGEARNRPSIYSIKLFA